MFRSALALSTHRLPDHDNGSFSSYNARATPALGVYPAYSTRPVASHSLRCICIPFPLRYSFVVLAAVLLVPSCLVSSPFIICVCPVLALLCPHPDGLGFANRTGEIFCFWTPSSTSCPSSFLLSPILSNFCLGPDHPSLTKSLLRQTVHCVLFCSHRPQASSTQCVWSVCGDFFLLADELCQKP